MPSRYLDQGIIIDTLNRYLKWHNLPLRLDEDGVCNGLASVYTKYALQGRHQAFQDMLEAIASKHPRSELQTEINHFVVEVVISSFPDKYDKRLEQTNATQALLIDGKPIRSAFNLALATSDENWSDIIRSLALQEDEVMRVSSVDHAIAVSKREGKYIVYDPNYPSAFKTFNTENELIKELHTHVFRYDPGPLGLSISISRHPANVSPRVFPAVRSIYDRYLTSENVNVEATKGDKQFHTLSSAAEFGDADAIEKLMELGIDDDEKYHAALSAIKSNNTNALNTLLSDIELGRLHIVNFFKAALEKGRKEAFDALLADDVCRAAFEHEFNIFMGGSGDLHASNALRYAAEGGNPLLLQAILDTCQRKLAGRPPIEDTIARFILKKEREEDAINAAIRGGSERCVRDLITKVTAATLPESVKITEERKKEYLLQAITTNQHGIVTYLLGVTAPAAVQSISLARDEAEGVDLSILHELQEHGVVFSEEVNHVIAKKEHQPSGFLHLLGVLWKRFTDFCVELFPRNEATTNPTEIFRQQLHEVREGSEEAPLLPPRPEGH